MAGLGLFFGRMDLPACQKLERSENRAGTHKKTYPLGALGRGRFLKRTPGPALPSSFDEPPSLLPSAADRSFKPTDD